MFDSQLYRKLSLAAAVLGFITMAGCSGQRGPVANAGSAQPANGAASKAAAANAEPAQPAGGAVSNAGAADAEPAQPAGGAASKAAAASPASASAGAAKPLHLVTLPKGTEITATVEQTLASNKNHSGDPFAARIVRPVKVGGQIVLPRGTEVTGSIYEVKKNELKVVLDSVVRHGVYCDLITHSRRPSDKDQPKRRGPKQKDNSTLSARTRLTFKLSKAAAIPVKA